MNLDFNDPTIDDLEFSKRFTAAVDKMVKVSDRARINHEQMRKLIKLVAFYERKVKELGGRFEEVSLSPTTPPNGLTADFEVFDLSGKEVQEFCDVMRECSAVSMDITSDDEISISCTIPNVFIYE